MPVSQKRRDSKARSSHRHSQKIYALLAEHRITTSCASRSYPTHNTHHVLLLSDFDLEVLCCVGWPKIFTIVLSPQRNTFETLCKCLPEECSPSCGIASLFIANKTPIPRRLVCSDKSHQNRTQQEIKRMMCEFLRKVSHHNNLSI